MSHLAYKPAFVIRLRLQKGERICVATICFVVRLVWLLFEGGVYSRVTSISFRYNYTSLAKYILQKFWLYKKSGDVKNKQTNNNKKRLEQA